MFHFAGRPVSHQLLDCPNVAATFQQVSGERITERVAARLVNPARVTAIWLLRSGIFAPELDALDPVEMCANSLDDPP